MLFVSTKDRKHSVSLRQAVLSGMAPDKGLYVPVEIPTLDKAFLNNLSQKSFEEIAFAMSYPYLKGEFSETQTQEMIHAALNFPIPLFQITENLAGLQLYHGPTLAFKDVGARFLAQLVQQFIKNNNKTATVLVATSGDTGGAVAAGFYGLEGIDVCVLYPKGLVSPMQEKQFATLGKNITAIAIDGTFDDCQRLVKEAFGDKELTEKKQLLSANSINIGRLIPQMIYYGWGVAQTAETHKENIFVVPSGNYGNLTAGVYAQKMGIPIQQFIAAGIRSDAVCKYLKTGKFEPVVAAETMATAMAVGFPNNFERLQYLYDNNLELMKDSIEPYPNTDADAQQGMKDCYNKYHYVLDPHSSMSYTAATQYITRHSDKNNTQYIFLETAHALKFEEIMTELIPGFEQHVDSNLLSLVRGMENRQVLSIPMKNNYGELKNFLSAHS